MTDPAEKRLTTRDLQRIETRKRIFDAAVAEFRRAGVEQTRIETIVKAAGVARGTFYVHFSSKEDVLRELQLQMEARILERLETQLGKPRSLRTFLERLTEALLAEPEDPVLAREILALAERRPSDARWAENPYFEPITRYFAALQKAGEVRADCNPAEITGVFLVSLFGFLRGPAAPARGRRKAIRRMIDFFIHGVAP
jgi:AcrR family transcriptional regulator